MYSFQSFPRRVLSVLLCSFLFIVLSCQKGDTVDPVSSFSDPVLQRLLDMGFDRNAIQDEGKYYVVEGDMKFHKKEDALNRARTSQLSIGDGSFPTLSIIDDITVSVGNFPTTTWRNKIVDATIAAISEWNSIPGSKVHFVYGSGIGDVEVIYKASLGYTQWGRTDTPPGCQVGPEVWLNYETENHSPDQLHFLLTHELGHTIGILHTDGQQLGGRTPAQIPGTPDSDFNSVMNSGTGLSNLYAWSVAYPNGFSAGDKNATAFLYPSATPLPNLLNSPDGSGNPVLVTWPPSFMCGISVSVSLRKQGALGYTKAASSVNNDGSYRFDTSNMTPGLYEVKVQKPIHNGAQITKTIYWF